MMKGLGIEELPCANASKSPLCALEMLDKLQKPSGANLSSSASRNMT